MATFPIKSDLSLPEQQKMDALLAIPVARRTASQVAWLAARLPYQTNIVISVDVDGDILAASGLTVPTSYSGFAKGATFIKTDATGKAVYENIGSNTAAIWNLMGDISSADIEDGAVTENKLATSLSFVGKTISLNESSPVNAAFATATLTTNNTECADGDTVTIGTTVYTFKDTPAAAYDVQRNGTTADTTLGNLIKAINATGTEGVEYFAGTLIHPTVSAGTLGSHASIMLAKVRGVAGNIAKDATSATLSWNAGETFTGGVDGTVGVKDQIEVDTASLYICIAANGLTGTNWRKISLGSAY